MAKAPRQLRGTILAFNISPKGAVEGAILETDTGIAQLNFPKHEGDALAKALRIGETIDLAAELEPDDGDHPVFRTCADAGRVAGTVVRFNYARHGEPNGYQLDNGTFVHVKPDGAKKYKVRIGDQIEATGSRLPGTDAVVLEAKTVGVVSKRARKSARA